MPRVLPSWAEAFIRSASLRVQQRVQGHMRLGTQSRARRMEQLRAESEKLAGAATQAEVLERLARVMDATAALAEAYDISAEQLQQKRVADARSQGMLQVTGRLLQPTVSQGLSALRTGWVITQTQATRVRAAERGFRAERFRRLRDTRLGIQAASSHRFARANARRWAAAARSRFIPQPPAWTAIAIERLLQQPAAIGSMLIARVDALPSSLDINARVRMPLSGASGAADLRLQLSMKRDVEAPAAQPSLADLWRASHGTELTAWLVSSTARLLFQYLVRPRLAGRVGWAPGLGISPFGPARLMPPKS